MNIKNKRFWKMAMLLANLLIMSFRCHAVDTWQPDPNTDWDNDSLWGNETNHLKVGLLLQYAPDTNHTLVGFYPILKNSSATNGNARPDWLQLWLPPFDSRYRLELTDINGNTISKTAKGKALGKPIDQPFKGSRGGISEGVNFAGGYRGQIIQFNTPDVISDPFVLEDYFSITNAGKYHLKFEMQIVWFTEEQKNSATITSNLPMVWLPPVNAEIEIKNP